MQNTRIICIYLQVYFEGLERLSSHGNGRTNRHTVIILYRASIDTNNEHNHLSFHISRIILIIIIGSIIMNNCIFMHTFMFGKVIFTVWPTNRPTNQQTDIILYWVSIDNKITTFRCSLTVNSTFCMTCMTCRSSGKNISLNVYLFRDSFNEAFYFNYQLLVRRRRQVTSKPVKMLRIL